MKLEVGQKIQVQSDNLDSKGNPFIGTITYIHPKGKFYTVEYKTPKGILRESFPLSNEDILNLIYEGKINGSADPFIPPSPHISAKHLEKRLLEAEADKSWFESLKGLSKPPTD